MLKYFLVLLEAKSYMQYAQSIHKSDLDMEKEMKEATWTESVVVGDFPPNPE